MVWFQCEDCGDNLKKPKLPGHFRSCSARKLSCIDCGEMFGQESVQSHTQCITEAEKYGPKGQGKALNGGGAKPNKDSKQQPDFDITVGLSKRFPWFCSLCNTKATSEQTLLLHAEGKKHRARARAIHAAKQQPKQPEESALDTKPTPENKQIEEPKLQDASRVSAEQNSSEAGNGTMLSEKKRKLDASKIDESRKKTRDNTSDEVIQSGKTEANGKESQLETDKLVESSSAKNESNMKIKWKKLITSTLKSNDGVLKMSKLKKFVLKAIEELGITDDEAKLSDMLDHKINSSSRFKVENKHVHLVAKD
ncbi:UBP1-associated proteins 1C [Prunus yedoensis var. nudiflora]|uniref:UBP1-associated proteins 1C n=1 Tax=Prunus yedoensis var. nudiflora TaxID=2094558 RepID=A0A315A410_PRUYE|nr:UBP1-associated proteins 1C [Prunus yedoensis var. nudiflora]PQQ08876.1 UBP1-associated proteins 1C [Prunus yedoensis var. nudiflora]